MPLQMGLAIKKVTFSEVKNEIELLNKKKAPEYDLINGKVLVELPAVGIQYLRMLYNSIMRTKHWPIQLKFAQIILIDYRNKANLCRKLLLTGQSVCFLKYLKFWKNYF